MGNPEIKNWRLLTMKERRCHKAVLSLPWRSLHLLEYKNPASRKWAENATHHPVLSKSWCLGGNSAAWALNLPSEKYRRSELEEDGVKSRDKARLSPMAPVLESSPEHISFTGLEAGAVQPVSLIHPKLPWSRRLGVEKKCRAALTSQLHVQKSQP